MVALEAHFTTLPGDVEEQRRRYELIRYAILPLRGSILTPFEQAQGYRGEVSVVIRGARAAAGC